MKNKYKNVCYNTDKMIDNLSLSEKLELFNKGPCSPTILIPGIMGTSL